jgi:hypothetical protein
MSSAAIAAMSSSKSRTGDEAGETLRGEQVLLIADNADASSHYSSTGSANALEDIDSEDLDVVPKVVADGHVILVPATYIHHHHTTIKTNTTSPVGSHESVLSTGATSSGGQNRGGSAGSNRGRQPCNCHVDNGGVESNEQGSHSNQLRVGGSGGGKRRQSSRSRSHGRI